MHGSRDHALVRAGDTGSDDLKQSPFVADAALDEWRTVNMPNRPTAERTVSAPMRRPEFAHLSLPGLRGYRETLNVEEGRVSYWRRIIQARLDLVQATQLGTTTTVEHVRGVFAEDRIALNRNALLTVLPVDDMPPLPALTQLWDREPRPGDNEHNARLTHDLMAAESQLSAYRAALHRRLASSTAELIARYREDPRQCFVVLPLGPAQPEPAMSQSMAPSQVSPAAERR